MNKTTKFYTLFKDYKQKK